MKQKELFVISIVIFLTVVAWLITDIYHTNSTGKIKINIETVKPINYEINANFFEILKQKTP